MYSVYVLKSLKNGKRYTGVTDNLQRRLTEHERGISRFTSQNRPWKLMYTEQFEDKSTALKREKFLKSGQGRKLLDSILN